MLKQLAGDILVNMIAFRQLQGDPHQIKGVHRHPSGAVRLVDVAAGWQSGRPIEDSDIVEPEKPALEDVAPRGVLAVDPPVEIQDQLVEHALQKYPFHPST